MDNNFNFALDDTEVEQFNTIDIPKDKKIDPQVLRDQADKYAFGTGLSSDDVHNQLSNGSEHFLRDSLAKQKSLAFRQEQNQLLMEYARGLDRPLTESELQGVDTFTKINPGVDPATVLEEAYGEAFSNLAITSARDPTVTRQVMSALPDAFLDGLDAVGQQVARREIANNLLHGLGKQHEGLADNFTVGNFFKEVGSTIAESLNPFVWNNNERYSDTPLLNLTGDYTQMMLPGYYNIKLGGWRLNLGDSRAEQYRDFMLLSPSEFNKRFSYTVESLAEDNLPLAMEYVHGFLHYSHSDLILDQVFGYADWLSVAQGARMVGIRATRGLKKAKEKFVRGTDVPPVSDYTAEEQIQHIKDFRRQLRDTAKAANAETPEEAATILGDVDGAAAAKVHKQLVDEFDGLDPFSDTVHLKGKLPGIFVPGVITDNVGSLDAGRVAKHQAHATAHANSLLRIATNNNAVIRLTQEQVEAAVELSRKQMLKDYDHINDAILDVDNGGPFRTFTPDEQLVNVFSTELRVGRLPEPPKVPSKTAITRNPNAVDDLVEYLRVEKTTHQNASLAKKEIYSGYNSLISEYHKRINEVGKKGTFLDFVNTRTGIGGLFDSMVEAIVSRTGKPLINGQLKRLQKELGLGPSPTGDVFLDRISALTARRGRILVRDLYDQMKREGKFEGSLIDFREKVKALRKERKLKMSSYKNDVLRPDDLPSLSPARKPKPVKVTPKQAKAAYGELPLGDQPKVSKTIIFAVRDDFAQKLFDSIASLRVSNPITGKSKFKLPGTKRSISVSNFPELAKKATAKFRRDFDQALDVGYMTSKEAQAMMDSWITFVKSTRERLPALKGSKKLHPYDVKKEVAARSKSQKAQFDVDEESLEEGVFDKEFARDVGYGNETFRNRLIDSGIVTTRRTKTGGTRRVHYIDPPSGFGPEKTFKPIPSRPQKYPKASPETDADLMMALTGLLERLAKTNNNSLMIVYLNILIQLKRETSLL